MDTPSTCYQRWKAVKTPLDTENLAGIFITCLARWAADRIGHLTKTIAPAVDYAVDEFGKTGKMGFINR
jgi:hypothetical protein